MICFYILSDRFFLKRKGLFDVRLVSISENNYGFAVIFFVKVHTVLKVTI